jgi:hypothetical protein
MSERPQLEITPRSKLFDVLNAYPQLEETIIEIAPPFGNLRNPVLRRTVGRLATLAQVAQIGNLDAINLVNMLRRAVGQPEIRPATTPTVNHESAIETGDPAWASGAPQFVIDGTALLAQGEVPLEHVNAHLDRISDGATLLLLTNFEPQPIFDAMQKQGRRYYHKVHPQDPGQHLTYIA